MRTPLRLVVFLARPAAAPDTTAGVLVRTVAAAMILDVLLEFGSLHLAKEIVVSFPTALIPGVRSP